jgi:import inner membrane translocase subunit TIM23
MATAAAPAPNADDILGQHRFVTPTGAPAASGPSSSPYAPTASSILAGTSLDAAALHPLAGVVDNKELDYLLLEDDKLSSVAGGKTVLPSRGWGDELCYGTGSTYLAGAPFSLLTYLMPLENI